MKALLIVLAIMTLSSCRVLTWTYHTPNGYYVTTWDIDNPFD